jgi:hypothetical protein
MITKTKTDSLSSLIKELDIWISRYVRLNAADDNGQCRCISCDAKSHWTLLDTAHFKDRDYMGTRFYLPNLAPACQSCNRYDPVGHLIAWRNKLTVEQTLDLEQRSKSLMKWARPELQEQIEFYKSEVRQLRKLKRL